MLKYIKKFEGDKSKISEQEVKKFKKKEAKKAMPFIQLSRSQQRQQAKTAQFVRQMPGDTVAQQFNAYRKTIYFHADATENKYERLVIAIRDHAQDPNAKDEDGRSALHFAARLGCVRSVKSLLRNDASVDDPDLQMRWTPLHYAAFGGHLQIVQAIIDYAPQPKISVNRRDRNGTTPLMLACGEGHVEVAKYLLSKRAYIEDTDDDDWTALHYCAIRDQPATAELLYNYGINTRLRTASSGETASEIAERLKCARVAIMLFNVS